MFDYYEFKEGSNITRLELLRPDGTSLGELNNAYNKNSKISLGEVGELTFSLPNVENIFDVISEENNTIGAPEINNDDISQISITLIGLQIKASYNNGLDIIYLLPNKTITSDMKSMETTFTCYTKEHELSRQLIFNYKGIPINGDYTLDALTLEEVLIDLFNDSFWSIGYLDNGYRISDPEPMKRTIEAFNNISLLATVDSLCNTYGAIPIYDTVNMVINFYRADNETYFKYNGLVVDESNYLNSVKRTDKTDELITRLYGQGKDELSINGVNPTGVSYIEDLSFFLYPATLNQDKTALATKSKYMSDELALAELLYEDKVFNYGASFLNLYTQKDTKLSEKIVLENQLTVLNTEMAVINDYIDVIFVGTNTAIESNPQYVAKRTEKNNKQAEIDDKQLEINNKQLEINAIDLQLKALYDDLKVEANFTNELLKERQCYIYEGLYTNTGISIEQDLYEEMVEYIAGKREPSIIIETSINNLFAIKGAQATIDRNKIKIGERIDVYYNYRGLDIDIRAQILSININEENNGIDLVIANTADYRKNTADYLEEILKRSITTSTTVSNNIIDWNKGALAINELDTMYEQGIDSAKMQINSAANNTVTINERGITITDTTQPYRFVRATNGVIALSKDGGETYSTAITPDGVWAERLIGQIILGTELNIQSDDVNTSLKISDIPANTYSDLSIDDFGIVVKSSKNRIFVSRERGFRITNLSGGILMNADVNGNLVINNATMTNANVSGTITAGAGAIGGWTIGANALYALNNGLYTTIKKDGSAAFATGSPSPFDAAGAPLILYHDGRIVATNATITGTITSANLTATGGSIGGIGLSGVGLSYSGTDIYDGFGLWRNGIHAHAGSYIIFHAGGNGINIGGARIRMYQNGTLVATNANISGTITAGSGYIGGWTIGSNTIHALNGSDYTTIKKDGNVAFAAGAPSPTDTTGADLQIYHNGRLVANNATIRGSISASTISGSDITGGSISIASGVGYFNMATTTNHPNCSGLNVGSYGIKATGGIVSNGDVTCDKYNITGGYAGYSIDNLGIRDQNGGVHHFRFKGGILIDWRYD